MVKRLIVKSVRTARRIVVAVVGGTVVLVGVALLVLPGPAMLVIPIGLAVLGLEFAWARHWLRRLRDGADAVFETGSALWKGPPGGAGGTRR
jgi:tellurite resistance protein TerC